MRVLSATDAQASGGRGMDDPKTLTEEEWRKRLTPEQYYVCTEGDGAGEFTPHMATPPCVYTLNVHTIHTLQLSTPQWGDVFTHPMGHVLTSR